MKQKYKEFSSTMYIPVLHLIPVFTILLVSLFLKPILSIEDYGFLLLALFVYSIYCLFAFEYGVFSYISLFFTVSFIIHAGHPVLHAIAPAGAILAYDQRSWTTYEAYLQACNFILQFHSYFIIGLIISRIATSRTIGNDIAERHPKIVSTEKENDTMTLLKKFGLLLLFVSLPLRVYIDVRKWMLYLAGDYLSTYSFTLPGYIQNLAALSDVSLLFLVVANRRKPAQRWIAISIAVALNVSFMFTGNRGNAMIRLIALAFVFFTSEDRPRLSYYLVVGSAFLLLLPLIITIQDLRQQDATARIYLNHYTKNLFSLRFLQEVIAQFGVSLRSVAESYRAFPDKHPFSSGLNYLTNLATVLPNIGGFSSSIVKSNTYVFYFDSYLAMGGSYVGEAYYAFGNTGVLLGALFSMVLGKQSDLIKRFSYQRRWLPYMLCSVPIASQLWWIRDYSYGIVREVALCFILLFLFVLCLNRAKGKNYAMPEHSLNGKARHR